MDEQNAESKSCTNGLGPHRISVQNRLKAKAALMRISVSEAISLWLNATEGMNDYNYVVLKTDPRALKAYNEVRLGL